MDYKTSGVDIKAGREFVSEIKQAVESTHSSNVIEGIGGFGGLFKIPLEGLKKPVLVSGTDGVGTKIELAQSLARSENENIDEFELQKQYEYYFIVRKCHEVSPLYISSAELQTARKNIKATDEYYNSRGVDTDSIYKKSEETPQSHIKEILFALELGRIAGFIPETKATCQLYLNWGMDKVESTKGKKDF